MTIDFRKNANVLAAVQEFAKPKQRTPSDPYVVDGGMNCTLIRILWSD
jgi:hypothetical protein